MKRGEFITPVGCAPLAEQLAAQAQQAVKVRRSGFLGQRALRAALTAFVAVLLVAAPGSAKSQKVFRIGLLLNAHLADGVDSFVAEMRRLGYVEGHNLVLDRRIVETAERNAALATELVALKPDILLGAGSQQVEALKRTTSSTPIVFANTADPVGTHLVDSLARPGSNVTGITNYIPQLAAKRLELVAEVVPSARRIAMLFNPTNAVSVSAMTQTEAAAKTRDIFLVPASVRSAEELSSALQRIIDEKAAALIGAVDIMISAHTPSIIAFAARQRLPTMFPYLADARAGALMSYGIDPVENYRRAAGVCHKILNGTRPEDVPVEDPEKFVLVINLKTAKALGLTIPPTLLARADEILE